MIYILVCVMKLSESLKLAFLKICIPTWVGGGGSSQAPVLFKRSELFEPCAYRRQFWERLKAACCKIFILNNFCFFDYCPYQYKKSKIAISKPFNLSASLI